MKVALCLSSLPLSGVGTSVGIIYSGLVSAGHDVEIVITSHKKGDDFTNKKNAGYIISALSPGERFLKRRLIKTIETLNKFDVVINNFSLEAQLAFPFIKHNISKFSTMRALNPKALELVSLNSNCLTSVIAISKEIEETLLDTDIECPVNLIPNCTLVKVDSVKHLSSPLKICYVGRLSNTDKNIFVIPEILSYLNNNGFDFEFVIAGDGPDKNRLMELFKDSSVEEKAKFLGMVSRDEVQSILSESHFCLIPSFFEGLSNVMLESMAIGCVPITSDISNFKWVLGREATKLQVQVNSANAYAKKIIELSSDKESYSKIQSYLIDRQQDFFSPDNTINAYVKLIHNKKCPMQVEEITKRFSLLRLPYPYNLQCTYFWRWLQVIKSYLRGAPEK